MIKFIIINNNKKIYWGEKFNLEKVEGCFVVFGGGVNYRMEGMRLLFG